MFKKFILMLISSMLLLNAIPVFAVNESIYYEASEKLLHGKVIFTYTVEKPFDGLYDKAQTTRAEFAAVILNALRKDVPPIAENSYFQDCDIKDWYTPYINTLFDLKIVSGYGNDNFKPKNIVTNYEAITMLVRCLGYEKIKTENETYPHKYLEIAEQLNLLENTTISKTVDEPLTYGNMFMLLLNAMRCNISDGTQRLWDLGLENSLYKKITGKVTSVNDSEYVVTNDTESITLIWNYNENVSAYLDKNVSVWFYQSDTENYVADMIIE